MALQFSESPDLIYPKLIVPVELEQKNVWLLRTLSLEDNRRAMSGLVYEDDIDSQYSYTREVPNSQRIKEGDLVLLRDNDYLLGAAVIQNIKELETKVEKLRCPRCGNAKLYWRAKYQDWRCDGQCLRPNRMSADNRSTRDPIRKMESTISYIAKYGDTWSDLAGAMLAHEFKSLADVGPWNPQNSIVRLNPSKVLSFFEKLKFSFRKDIVPSEFRIQEGFEERIVRRRLGQTQFRVHLVNKYKNLCAITGPCSLTALDAAHLYSYAEEGRHIKNGGLLMRKDIHALFDSGLLGIDSRQRVALNPSLAGTQHETLHGQRIQVAIGSTERHLLAKHFERYLENFITS